jgi:hypothetical protein
MLAGARPLGTADRKGRSTPLSLPSAAMLDPWWKPKASNLLGVIYSAVLVAPVPFPGTLVLLGPSLLAILGIGSFGHLVNDSCDLESDAAVGKKNRLAALPPSLRRGVILGALALALPLAGPAVGRGIRVPPPARVRLLLAMPCRPFG